VYSGDNTYTTSTSSAFDQTILYGTSVEISADAQASASSSDLFEAVVSGPGLDHPPYDFTGTVSFDADGSPISGCQNLGVSVDIAECSTTLPSGTHSIMATYSGDSRDWGSTSPSFSQAVTGVSVTSSQNPASPVSQVTFQADVTETDGGGSVSFTDGGTAISGCQTVSLNASDIADCTTTAGAMGNHSIRASYSGDSATPAAVSPAVTEVVYGVSAVSAPPALAHSPFSVTFDTPVQGIATSNFAVVDGTSSTAVAGAISCTNSGGGTVDCNSGPVSAATLTPTKSLTAGEYYVVNINGIAGGIETTGGAAVPATTVVTRAQTQFAPFDPALTYKWATVKDPAALGGSYVEEDYPNATQTFTAKGSSVGIVTLDGPTGGTATVTVTTPHQTTVTQVINTYQATLGEQTTTISNLPNGTHTVTLSVNGANVSPSTGTWVRLDGVVVNGVMQETPKTTALWPNFPGSYTYTGSKGASITLTFRGTGVVWSALTGPNDGRAKVAIDGFAVRTEDLYASGFGATDYTFKGLANQLHKLVITALGTHDSSSTSDIVTYLGLTVQ
jgi:hypothetical protein